MATYLATIQIGPYEHRRVERRAGTDLRGAPARLRAAFDYDFGRQPQMMDVFEKLFGPYPFADYTVVVTDDELEIPIEAQGLSIFGANHCDGVDAAPNVLSRTSLRTSGSATASPSGSGATSGCTRVSPATPSGSGPRTPVAPIARHPRASRRHHGLAA